MLKKLCAVLLTVVVLTGSGTVAAFAYTPDQGALFNNPRGDAASKNVLAAKLRSTIASAPKHSVIRIAVYSFDRKELGDALIAACDRRVAVQVVINDNWISGQVKRLQRRLGTNIDPRWGDSCNPRTEPTDPLSTEQPYPEPSFLKVCHRACRVSGPGNQHMKIYMFSRAGQAENVIMVGSNNMTHYAARTHWNDMFTVQGQAAMFESYSTVFRQLAEDKPVAQPYLVFTHGNLTTEFGPLQGVPRSQDPVARRLAGVNCKAIGGTGADGRTVIRIAMYAWSGERGRYLANRVADLRRKGCIVRAILSGARKDVKHALRRGGVKLRSADLNLDDDDETGFGETPWEHFTHEKWMALDGTWNGAPTRSVWTGSENWSDKSLQNDEITVQIARDGVYRAYARHFDTLWNSKKFTRPL